MNSYRDLIVWQRAMELVVSVYQLTDQFSKNEIYGLTSQMRRSAVSIPSNIAEGRHRGTRKDFRQFLIVAYGSGAELETQLEIVRRLSLSKHTNLSRVSQLLTETMKMLNKMIASLQSPV